MAAPAPARADLHALETDDLRLVYPAPALSFLAPYAARCFENSIRFHERLFDYRPSEKVNVILDDASDFGNAGVTVVPRNTMIVHIAPVNFVYETGPSNERINFTMNHEGVHVAALDEAAGADRFFRGLFGGKVRETSRHPESVLYSFLTTPRRAAPRWYHEGAAVFLETWMAGGLGRAQGPYDEMVFRAMTKDGSRFYDPLGLESEGAKVDFQVGVNSYLYGTRFMTYLAYEYGPDSLIRWVARRPGSHRWFARQFRAVYGRPLGEEWRRWIAWERRFQTANLDSIRLHPVTGYRDLSDRALGSVSRAYVDPASHALIAAAYYPGAPASLVAVPLPGAPQNMIAGVGPEAGGASAPPAVMGPPRRLLEVKGPALYFVSSLAFDPESRTVFYTADNNEWRDLCAYDLRTKKSRVLQKNARVGDLAWNASDGTLWGIRHMNGISTLVRMMPPYTDYTRIASWPFGRDLYDIDLSPDGKLLAGSLAEINGRQSLRLWRTDSLLVGDTTSVQLYDFGASIPAGFVFAPDGRRLYGSSYYTGVSNIFRYDLDGDSMSVVTNAETGFFRPIPLGGDSLIVFRYAGGGFVPATIEAHPLTDVSAITFLGQALTERRPVVTTWRVPPPSTVPLDSLVRREGTYRAASALGLASIYPVVEGYKSYTAAGLQAALSDPLGLDAIDLSLSYSPARQLAAGERWHAAVGAARAPWKMEARWNGASFYDLGGPTKVSRKGYGGRVEYARALMEDTPKSLDLTVAASGWGGLERLPDYQNISTSPGFDKLLSGSAGLQYRNLRGSIGSVDYERGWRGSVAAATDGVRFVRGGNAAWRGFPHAEGTFDVGMPLPVPHASVWLRTAAGLSPGDRAEPFANFYFGGFGNNVIDWQDPKRYRTAEAFPGTELNAIAGTNYAKTTLDLNLPPIRFRRAGSLALYATWLRASVFASGLVTNLDDASVREEAADLGVQADLRLQLLTQSPLTLSAGYARAVRRGAEGTGEWMVSLKIL
ncbi:MAG: TolB family protein [Bacteroidota bacterium]